MPYIFRLNSEPEGTTLDLVVEETWSPAVSYDGSDVVETIPINIAGASDDAQAANLQALHRIQENVRYYVNEPSSQHTQETWLEWQMADESLSGVITPRRRLVKAMDIAFDQGMWFTCGEGNVAREMRVVLTLRCTGWWEMSSFQGIITSVTRSLMVPLDFLPPAGVLYGDAPARLSSAVLSNTVGGAPDDIYGAYIAFRSEKRHGTLANFVPLWELEDGTPLTDTAAVIQAGASPSDVANNCLETTFATFATFLARATIEFSDVTVNFSDNYGRYLVLYRGQVDAATTCTVRVDARHATAGAINPDPIIAGTEFTVDNATTWRVFDTGLIVQLPPLGTHTGITIEEQYGFTVTASRTAGAGSLYSDCLILVPIDEFMIYYNFIPPVVSGIYSVVVPPGDEVVWGVYAGPDGSTAGNLVGLPSATVIHLGIPYWTGEGIPPGADTRVYLTFFNTVNRDNNLTERANVNIGGFPRYHSLNGAG